VNVIVAFTAEQVSRLTGLSDRQLRYWDDTGFFKPSLSDERHRPYGRIYSFRDVVGLRTIALMRNKHGVPLQELRKLGAWLAEHYDQPWATLRFYLSGRAVYFDDPATQTRRTGRSPEQTSIIEMLDVAEVTAKMTEGLRRRDPDEIGQVSRHRYVSHNQPVISGTRIRTEAIWNFHQAGYGTAAILKQYPRLTPDDIAAAIDFECRRRQRVAG
jgi:DNA-binding transcriptional MerR regulator